MTLLLLDRELKRYGSVQQIRWVASQNRALTALLDDITVVHLEDIASGRDESSANAKAYLKEMKSERFLTFLRSMIDCIYYQTFQFCFSR